MDEAQLARARERRRDKLLSKWGDGKRLTRDELAEIDDFLPKAPVPAPVLVLESPVEGKKDRKYQRLQNEYMPIYDASLRTIKRWVKMNAPLDEPEKMADWWADNMKHRPPAKILELAGGTPVVAPGAEAVGLSDTNPLPDGSAMTPLEQARAILGAAYNELRLAQAANPPVPARITLAQRSYNSASEQLRRIELADPKIQAAAGAVVEKEAVRSILMELHTAIHRGVRGLVAKVRPLLAGKSKAEQESIWQKACDELFARYNGRDFLTPV